jgi:phage gpG-like protein
VAADFDVKTEGGGGLTRVILVYSSKAQASDKLTPIAAKMLHAAVLDVFEAQGPGWAPLAPSTLEHRRGGSGMILQDTGAMAGTLGEFYGSDYAEVAAAVAYAIYHVSDEPRQQNAEGEDRLPQRDFTNLGPFEAALLEDVGELIANQVASA